MHVLISFQYITLFAIPTSRVGVVVARLTCNEKVIRSIRVRGKVFASTTWCQWNGWWFLPLINFYLANFWKYCVPVTSQSAARPSATQLSRFWVGYYFSLRALQDTTTLSPWTYSWPIALTYFASLITITINLTRPKNGTFKGRPSEIPPISRASTWRQLQTLSMPI